MGFIDYYIDRLGREAEREIEETVLGYLPWNKKAIYLDCGCAGGEKTLGRGEKIGTSAIFGVEIVEKERLSARKRGIETYDFDLNARWPLKDNSIDIITVTEVVEHLTNLDIFFAEAKRCLKEGGILIISTENLAGLQNIFALVAGNQPYTGPYLSTTYPLGRKKAKYFASGMSKYMRPHLSVMTFKALIKILRSYGFEVVKYKGVSFYPFPFPLSRLLPLIDRYHSAYAVVLARK